MSNPGTERIIGHMNNDHQLALVDYVVVYGDTRPDNLLDETVQIVSVDEKQLVIEYELVKPPIAKTLSLYWYDAKEDENVEVKTLGDVKAKLIAMAKYCAKEQGYAIKKLEKIHWPGPLDYPMYVLWAVLLANAYDPAILRKLVDRVSVLKKAVGYLPPVAFTAYQHVESNALKYVVGLFVTHLAEVLLVTKGYLRKYRVPDNHRWVWYLMHLIEGFPFIFRLKNAAK
ncbi:hypothetical protein Cantr_07689 [Candida viswanathii]|uniref:DUF2470 domain-containing protein n=1 Tax=Candida viswanathii TaxID=5486 RepID=A0A367Y165_9ASCO|nr:hypothetical protein Cantr_07689 [Candida viswanathii]